MHLFLWGFPFIFTIVYSFPQYTNPNQLTENMYLGSSASQGAWSNPDLQGSIIPASDSIQMYSQQWDMSFPSKFNPIDSSPEISGSTALSASTLNNHSGTQLVNAGNSFLAHSSISPETGTTSADTSHPDVNFINTPVDSLDETPYNIAFPGTGEGSKSPPNYASSEVANTEISKVSSIPLLSHPTPPNLAQNEQVTINESGDRANVDSNLPTSSGQRVDQALIDGDSPLPNIPFSDILPKIFQPPSFDTPRELPDIDKTPEQQPLYDPEERVADPKRPDCEDGTYAMCCSLGPPRLPKTTPAEQVIHRKRMCEIFGTSWEGCHWRQNVFCCVCSDFQLFAYGCKSPIYSQDPYYSNHEPPPPKDFGKLRVEQKVDKGLPDEQPKRPKPLTDPGSGTSPGRPKKDYKCTKEQLNFYRNGGTEIFPAVSN